MVAEISASILTADFARLGDEIKILDLCQVDYIHLDVMDGQFVPNISFGPFIISKIRSYTNIPFDVHLMINSPGYYIENFVKAGADLITIHVETDVHLDRIIKKIKSHGKKVGLSLVPSTPPNVLEYVIHELDLVLIMTVNPGFGGQSFLKEQLKKITYVREMIKRNSLDTKISVDGGIDLNNASDIIKAGADILVVGSTIFKAEDKIKTVRLLKEN